MWRYERSAALKFKHRNINITHSQNIQFMANNVDHNPCNLDGKNTIHYTGTTMAMTSFSDDTFCSYPTSCLKPVRIKLKSWYLACKYTLICSCRKCTFWYQGLLNFADVSIFCKKSVFFSQNSTFTQSNSVRALLEIF